MLRFLSTILYWVAIHFHFFKDYIFICLFLEYF